MPQRFRDIARRARRSLTPGLTRDDVIWCYRTLLQREPETEAVVRWHLTASHWRSMVQAFIGSDEFQTRRPTRLFHPLALPPARIDVDIGPERMNAMLAKVRATWRYLGDQAPHFSVLTHDQFRPERLADSIDVFWASGESEATQLVELLARHHVDPADKVCVEFGCGVGRVTVALASRFRQVHGCDISQPHLDQAQVRIDELGLTNVALQRCGDAWPMALPACDVLYSRIVLQHNPPPLMRALIGTLLQSLRPGGLAIFQLPVFAQNYSFDVDAWLRRGENLDMEMHCLPQPEVFAAIAAAGCEPVEVREDDSTGDTRFISNVFFVRRPASPAAPAAISP
jgi:SAM-dependent methyltransferase